MPIHANPCQSSPIQRQSEATCLSNLGTSALYGMVPSLLEGRIEGKPSRHELARINANPNQSEPNRPNPISTLCQSNANSPLRQIYHSLLISVNPRQFNHNPLPNRYQFLPPPKNTNSPIHANSGQSMSITQTTIQSSNHGQSCPIQGHS